MAARAFHKQVPISFTVPEVAKLTLDRQARDRGLQPSAWANQVFDLGFAAVCARERSMPITDADLDAVVGATLLLREGWNWDAAKIAKGLGVSAGTVVRILDGWRDYRRGAE